MKHNFTRQCGFCGKQFTLKTLSARFCSGVCAQRNRYPHYKFEKVEDYLESLLDKSGGKKACWCAAEKHNRSGYLSFGFRGIQYSGHALAWRLANPTESPDGPIFRHLCGNSRCCNPDHILPGTLRDNMDDRIAHGRFPLPKGLANKITKFDLKTVLKVRKEYAIERNFSALARKYGVCHNVIKHAVRGQGAYKDIQLVPVMTETQETRWAPSCPTCHRTLD